jgi:hypothetical protein
LQNITLPLLYVALIGLMGMSGIGASLSALAFWLLSAAMGLSLFLQDFTTSEEGKAKGLARAGTFSCFSLPLVIGLIGVTYFAELWWEDGVLLPLGDQLSFDIVLHLNVPMPIVLLISNPLLASFLVKHWEGELSVVHRFLWPGYVLPGALLVSIPVGKIVNSPLVVVPFAAVLGLGWSYWKISSMLKLQEPLAFAFGVSMILMLVDLLAVLPLSTNTLLLGPVHYLGFTTMIHLRNLSLSVARRN